MKSTRKYLLAVAVLAIGFAGPLAHAADDTTPPAKKEGARPARPDLKEALGLTAEQETKVKAIQADAAEKVKALPKEERRAGAAKIRSEADAKIEALLTPEQKAKFDALKAKRAAGPKGEKGDKPKHDETK